MNFGIGVAYESEYYMSYFLSYKVFKEWEKLP